MDDDYLQAGGKHLDDAFLLLAYRRFDNAAYLSGYVVECSLKALVQAFGVSPRPFRHHLPELSGAALRLASLLSPGRRRYTLPASNAVRAVCQEWVPSMRYSSPGSVLEQEATQWCEGADQVYRAIVVPQLLDGKRIKG